MKSQGIITRISGPVVTAEKMRGSHMYELVHIGHENLIGEIIGLERDVATIQVYEETSGIHPGEPVTGSGMPLSVELGPGLLGTIYDGIQRQLTLIQEESGDYITRGIDVPALDRTRLWEFTPTVSVGDHVVPGDIFGTVPETPTITHRLSVPPGVSGTVATVAEGEMHIDDTVLSIQTEREVLSLSMIQQWPVRRARPFSVKMEPCIPLVSGQRVIDTFFPLTKGGTAAVPGPFGSGKTVVQQQLAKWVDADIIVYVGCGERGNEMADVLREFPSLEDPRTGEPLMKRTVLIANTSNMPVAAREASVYTGISIAEYYRDMGYDVALMADSTSRWAEAMREISGRLEEMPGEEGYPAYLASRLAEFYERAGRVTTTGTNKRTGSVSIIGAVSPPGGDFSEPVTQNTLRIVKVFWALDADLANKRHFPAINWLESYSLYADTVGGWWREETGEDWSGMRTEIMALLQKESELEEIVQLVGSDVLPDHDKLCLIVAEIVRESYLIQNAFHPVDTYCTPKKQFSMIAIILDFYHLAIEALEQGVPFEKVRSLPVLLRIARMGTLPEEHFSEEFASMRQEMEEQFNALNPAADNGEGGDENAP